VRRENSDRPVAAKGDDEAGFGVAFAHMLYRVSVLISMFVAKRFYRGAKCGLIDKASHR
jgi:hypothetical protein